LFSVIIQGCSSIGLDNQISSHSHLYFGTVRISIPPTYGEIRAMDVSTLGLGADESIFLGWRHGRFVYVKPGRCQFVLIIHSQVEAEHMASIFRALEGDQLCVADFSGTLVRP